MSKQIKAGTQSGVYSGEVKLKLKKGNTTYKVVNQHNSGTLNFFKYILNTMKGDVLVNERPTYVKLIYTASGTTSTSKYGVIYESVTDAEDSSIGEVPQAKITYTFIIPETVVEKKTLTGLQLESQSGVVYATVALQTPINIVTNTNIELKWVLYMCNQ